MFCLFVVISSFQWNTMLNISKHPSTKTVIIKDCLLNKAVISLFTKQSVGVRLYIYFNAISSLVTYESVLLTVNGRSCFCFVLGLSYHFDLLTLFVDILSCLFSMHFYLSFLYLTLEAEQIIFCLWIHQ